MTRVLKGFHSFTCTPTRSSAIGMSHSCLCLPSCSCRGSCILCVHAAGMEADNVWLFGDVKEKQKWRRVLLWCCCCVCSSKRQSVSTSFTSHAADDMKQCSYSVSRYQNVSIMDFIGAKDDGVGSDNWSYKTYKAPVKSSPSTNQHPTFLQAGLSTRMMCCCVADC